ncbi:MAG: MaoC/PaaZ C-terminal domain-containing protein [Bradymonadia bacterium]
MQFTIPRDLPIRYAGAARDFNPIHLFPEDAQAAGFDRPVLHGMCVLGWVAGALEEAAGRPLTALHARFAAPAQVGDTVHVQPEPQAEHWTATVTDTSGRTLLKQIRGDFDAQPLPTEFPDAGQPRRQHQAIISASKIRELRDALGLEGSEGLAPTTFAAVACQRTVFALLDSPEVGLGIHGSIHTAQKLYLAAPITAGQAITVTAAIQDDVTRRGLRRATVRSRIEAGHGVGGALMCVADWVLTRRV